jgi:hypothetical protein
LIGAVVPAALVSALIGVIVALIGVIAADILAGVADCGFNAQVMDRWPTFKKE